jgi:hypothetical protein
MGEEVGESQRRRIAAKIREAIEILIDEDLAGRCDWFQRWDSMAAQRWGERTDVGAARRLVRESSSDMDLREKLREKRWRPQARVIYGSLRMLDMLAEPGEDPLPEMILRMSYRELCLHGLDGWPKWSGCPEAP